MNSSLSFKRLAAAAIVAAAAATGPMPQAAHAEQQGPDVPSRIEVEAGNKVFLVGHAVGVQIYTCRQAASGGFAWSFVAPGADLYGDNGQHIATHFGGPTWQANDGSSVVAQRVDGVTVDASAIPWLVLSKVSTSEGADGDRLAGTTFIQRTATTGGLSPAASQCTAETAGTTADVPYTADYFFWKATAGS
jgi:hypothetical protein